MFLQSVPAERFKKFSTVGHINIYLPTLFRFLLMSEGLEIKKELLLPPSKKMSLLNLPENSSRLSRFHIHLSYVLRPLRLAIKRIWQGATLADELSFSSYTCLTEIGNPPQILSARRM
jgi:hypothetical protein